MRVAVRRLLSAIRMFAPVLRLEGTRGLFQALKTIFTHLGGVREADVFIAETFPLLAAAGLGKTLDSFSAEKSRPFALPPIRAHAPN